MYPALCGLLHVDCVRHDLDAAHDEIDSLRRHLSIWNRLIANSSNIRDLALNCTEQIL
jgi:hypothetical protein